MTTTTHLEWKGLEDPTLEHCTITSSPGKILVQSKIGGLVNEVQMVVEYELQLDTLWNVSSVEVKINDALQPQFLKLVYSPTGEWTDAALHVRHDLKGCKDIDISLTPFTNTLPVKRLCLEKGESREIKVVYIDLPAFDVKAQQQRYTYLGNNRFAFEVPDTGYKNEITFTADGYVWHYPNLFEMTENYQHQG